MSQDSGDDYTHDVNKNLLRALLKEQGNITVVTQSNANGSPHTKEVTLTKGRDDSWSMDPITDAMVVTGVRSADSQSVIPCNKTELKAVIAALTSPSHVSSIGGIQDDNVAVLSAPTRGGCCSGKKKQQALDTAYQPLNERTDSYSGQICCSPAAKCVWVTLGSLAALSAVVSAIFLIRYLSAASGQPITPGQKGCTVSDLLGNTAACADDVVAFPAGSQPDGNPVTLHCIGYSNTDVQTQRFGGVCTQSGVCTGDILKATAWNDDKNGSATDETGCTIVPMWETYKHGFMLDNHSTTGDTAYFPPYTHYTVGMQSTRGWDIPEAFMQTCAGADCTPGSQRELNAGNGSTNVTARYRPTPLLSWEQVNLLQVAAVYTDCHWNQSKQSGAVHERQPTLVPAGNVTVQCNATKADGAPPANLSAALGNQSCSVDGERLHCDASMLSDQQQAFQVWATGFPLFAAQLIGAPPPPYAEVQINGGTRQRVSQNGATVNAPWFAHLVVEMYHCPSKDKVVTKHGEKTSDCPEVEGVAVCQADMAPPPKLTFACENRQSTLFGFEVVVPTAQTGSKAGGLRL